MRSKIATLTTASAICLLVPGISAAVDWSFSARAETGVQYYSFDQSPVTRFSPLKDRNGTTVGTTIGTRSSRKYADWMPMLGVGGTVSAGRFAFDASYQKAFNGSDSDDTRDTSVRPFNPAWNAFASDALLESKQDFDREEGALSLAYAATPRFFVFAGWKWAKTEFSEKRNGSFQIDQSFQDPDNLGIFNPAEPLDFLRTKGDYQDKLKYDFKNNGPFVGAAYGWRFDGGTIKGSLSANIAIAFLDGKFTPKPVVPSDVQFSNVTQSVNGGPAFDVPDDTVSGSIKSDRQFDGDTTGVTFGLNWRGQTQVKDLNYLLGINMYQYNFDADNSISRNGGDVDETVVTLRAGLAYSF